MLLITNEKGIKRIANPIRRIVSIARKTDILSEVRDLRKWVLTILLIGLAILLIPFSFVINNIQRPISILLKHMRLIKSGKLTYLKNRIELDGYSEIRTMADEFNGMLYEIDNLTKNLIETSTKLYETELMKKQSEIAFLRSQINPHFLYNTLESIKSISSLRGINEVRDMSMALGNILRYSINGDDFVPLGKEIEIVQSYVRIQQIRFKNRFTVHYMFDEDIYSIFVTRMLLQPLVENAVYHIYF